jgi:Flp pilus assembly protein TadD
MTEEERLRHNRLYETGCRLAKGDILVDDYGLPPRLGWLATRRLKRAIRYLRAALELAPDNWSALWLVGKIHQRLDRPTEALEFLTRAFDLNPGHRDVAREAGIAACEAGDGVAAVRFCEAAVGADPQDAGLLSNLALALLISGDFPRAQSVMSTALARAPEDNTIKTVQKLVEARSQLGWRPNSTRELFRKKG